MGLFLMIRHGESTANAGASADTPPDKIPITDLGREQAERVAAGLTERPDLIVTSSYIRTQQTAAPTIKKFPDVPVEVWPVQEFTFLDPAACAGTTYQERRPRVKAYLERCDPNYRDAPICDSFNHFADRCVAFLERARGLKEQTVYAFMHSQFILLTLYILEHGDGDRVELMKQFCTVVRHQTIDNCEVIKLNL